MDFSVIIPTYNRARQLLLTLAALNCQKNPKASYEVIVVDDKSTDDTQKTVKTFEAKFPLTLTRTERNSGRASARNRGISLAKGRYLIFCDADFIVTPKFIQIVRGYHIRHPKAVISGIPVSWNTAYTHYYPNFTHGQRVEMYNILQPLGLWKDSFWGEEKRIVPVLKQEDICNNYKKIKGLLAPWSFKVDTSIQKPDVAPWLLFVTRCVSVKKQYVECVGGFDEQFTKYGMEDWELGYRLHRIGLSFVSIDQTIGYHQEHPRERAEPEGIASNLHMLYKKFGFSDPELNLCAISPPWINIAEYVEKLRKLKKYRADNRHEAKRVKEAWKRKAIDFYLRRS